MTEELKLDLMRKFKKLNVAEYTTKYGDYYGLMFAGAEIATKELQEQVEKMKCCENCRYRGQINNCTYEYYSRCAYECKNYSLWEFKEWELAE